MEPLISVTTARQIIAAHLPPPAVTEIPLDKAAGCVLAAPVYADTDIPGFRQSSMDGYAFAFGDYGRPLQVTGEMPAGARTLLETGPGEAVRVFTGAPLPLGADTVVMQEKTVREGDRLEIRDPEIVRGSNVRAVGSEVRAGALAMKEGQRLSPAATGYLAGIGKDRVRVYRAPKVGIILTGDELQSPGSPLAFGQVYESNSYALQAVLEEVRIREITLDRAADDIEALVTVLRRVLAASDVVLLTGGVSVGAYDFVTAAAAACGVEKQFHRVRQKPGKPLFFGTFGEKLVFGLPGNPSSVLTCFYQYVGPVLKQLTGGGKYLQVRKATLQSDYVKKPGLTHFLKGWYENGTVTPLGAQESYRMGSFAHANCFICLEEEGGTHTAGQEVTVQRLPGEFFDSASTGSV